MRSKKPRHFAETAPADILSGVRTPLMSEGDSDALEAAVEARCGRAVDGGAKAEKECQIDGGQTFVYLKTCKHARIW